MGLPIITKIGNSFSSRVCSSFLKVMGLEELITSSADNYENLAIDLAINSKKLSLLKAKLIKNKNIQSLFDTENYIRSFEVNLESLWK